MASSLVDLVKINITSTGTGALKLGTAATGYRGVEALTNGREYSYSIQQGSNWEIGRGTYLSGTNQMVRSVLFSSSGGSAIKLTVGAQVAFTALSEDLDNANLYNLQKILNAADQAVLSAAAAEALVGPSYTSMETGLAATPSGECFAVVSSDITSIYLNSGGTAVYLRNVVTTDGLASSDGSSFIGAQDGSSGSLWTTVQGFINKLLSSAGASVIGFVQAGTGAVARTVQDKERDQVSVKDFGAIGDGTLHTVAEWIIPGVRGRYADLAALQVDYPHVTSTSDSIDWAAIQAAINTKATIGGCVNLPSAQYVTNKTLSVNGNFGYRSIRLQGDQAEIYSTHAGAAILFTPSGPPSSPQIKQRSEMHGLTFLGPGNTVVGSVGMEIDYGAGVRVSNCKFRSYQKGIYGLGALILRFLQVELYNNAYGFYFEPSTTPAFAPNDIHFNSCFIFENIRAGYAAGFPNGMITFNQCEMEGNNASGTASDGIKVFEFDKAGIVNIIGCHLEANFGQWHILFSGGAQQASLNIVGGQLIPGNNNTSVIEMNTAYGSYGYLNVVGARITNTITNQIMLGTGAKAVIIGETAGNIQGDLSNLVFIKNGRISTGVSYTPADAAMRSKGRASIAHDFEGQIRFVDSSNTRLAYIQAPSASTMAVVNDNDDQAIQFNTKSGGTSAVRFYIGRIGSLSVEPGADNTYTLGSAALRWSTVYAGTGTINTSDARTKQQVRTLSEAEHAVAVACKSLLRAFKFNDAVEAKGDGARWHFGVIAQDVAAAFEAEGLNAHDYGLFCYDEWEAKAAVTEDVLDDEGNPTGETRVIVPAIEAGNRYGIRYEELLAFIVAAL